MKTYYIYTVSIADIHVSRLVEVPIEVQATSHDKAARTYYKRLKKWFPIEVIDDDNNTCYYSRETKTISQYELRDTEWIETRKILL